MDYNFNRDLKWLLVRPLIWIPRFLYIIFSLVILAITLLIQGSNNNIEVQRKLAKKIFNTLIDLGPCFIKVGQALSTRPDLIRRDWLEELTKLQDSLPPFDHNEAIKILSNELGSNPQSLFLEFPKEPIASASLGIVYKALLYTDYHVAVKIQRPDLEFIIELIDISN